MVAADIARTTELTPEITARWDEELQTAVLACYGECPTSPISIREPEAICEVADIVRDKVTDMLWTVWPACSADGKPVEPRVSTDKPSGYAARAITPPTESANLKPAGAADDLYAADERPPSRSATHTFNTSRTTAHGFGALSLDPPAN